MEEIWDIYDENRNLTGKTIKRAEYINKIKENEYHLVVHIWIKNDKNGSFPSVPQTSIFRCFGNVQAALHLQERKA